MRLWLMMSLLHLCFAPAIAAVKHSEAKELQAIAKAYGLPSEVSDAAAAYIDTGDATRLRELLRRDELLVAVGAASLLFEMGEPFAADVVARLKRGEGSAEVQITCLAFATDRASVQYLVERLSAEKDEKLRKAITTSLRVISGESLTTGEQWLAWWRKQPRRYRPKSRTMDEVLSKIAMAGSANVRDMLQNAAKKFAGKKGSDALESVAGIIGDLAEMQEAGRKLRLSRPAKEGDANFARGDFGAAAAAYGRAVEKQRKDDRSAFLQACALLELGKLTEAREIFTQLHREDNRRAASAFMAEVCGKELAEPGRLLEHAVNLRKTLGEPEDLMTWGDPTLGVIVGQKLAMIPGPEYVDLEKVTERFAAEQDPLVLVGLALCHPTQMHEQLLKVLAERFPNHPVIVSQYLRRRSSWRTAEFRTSYLPAIRAWVAAEPDNALPRLLEIAVLVEYSALLPDQAPHPSEEILVRLEDALRLPRYETHVTTVARAQLAALTAVECASVSRFNALGSQRGISHLLSWLSHAANGALVRQESDLLDRISEIHAAITSRESTAARASMDRTLASAYKRMSRNLQLKHLRLHRADDPRLLQFEAEDEAMKLEIKQEAARMSAIALEILPVPSLQRALLRETYQISEE